MAVKRGPDGIPVDVPSVMHKKSKASSAKRGSGEESLFGSDEATIPPTPSQSEGFFPSDSPTVAAGGESAKPQGPVEPRTVIAGGIRKQTAQQSPEKETVPAIDPLSDPVVGWLVIIDGPGKGNYLKLGNGQNNIGRGEDQRVTVDFGDEQISRNNHAVLTFDPRGRQFYIQQGSGANLAYLDNKPVLSPTELPEKSRLMLGDTTMLFVPLCGEDFNW